MLTVNRNWTGKTPLPTRGILGTTGIFRDLPDPARREAESRMKERRYAKGESIFLEGDPARMAWFVKEGHVKAVANAADGRCQTLCMVGPGRMFGSCCCFGGGEYPCHALAETDTVILSLPLEVLNALMAKYPQVASALAAEISQKLRHTKDTLVFEQEPVERRILHALKDLVVEFGGTIPLTKREVAEMVGTTVETSIRTFSRLEEEGLVSTIRGRITVRNLGALNKKLGMS